ncbi:MAG: CRISPR-associated protein Cas6 [Deltaproteobacteria bacterium]|nr:MAG: CRISPR-associated protein Cas6 [Deltaproteobacteria bacterium]
MLDGFRVSVIRFNLRAKEPIILPHTKGVALRGAIGISLKKTVCTYRDINKECGSCMLNTVCPYPAAFEPLRNNLEVWGRRFLNPPRPFVIKPFQGEKTSLEKEEPFHFDLVVIGKAISLIPYFTLAVKELSEKGIGKTRGKFVIEGIKTLNYRMGFWKDIFNLGKGVFTERVEEINWGDFVEKSAELDQNRITLLFVTPTKIRFQGKVIFNPDFTHIIKRLTERILSLYALYCNGTADEKAFPLHKASYVKTVSRKVRWIDTNRQSTKTGNTHPIGGFTGSISFEGELRDFLPLLLAGELIHIGKNTTFGNGWYKVVNPSI